MIIECAQCQKQYNLEDAKITNEGITIRCTQCNTIFVVRSYGGLNSEEQPCATELSSGQQGEIAETVPGPVESSIPESAYLDEEEIPYAQAKTFGADENLSADSQLRATRAAESMLHEDSLSLNEEPSVEGKRIPPSSNKIIEGIESTKKRRKFFKAFRIFLYVLFIFFVVVGLQAGYHAARGKFHLNETAPYLVSKINALFRFNNSEKGSIQFSELNGYFVTRGKDNRVFVIEGKATNDYKGPCSFLQLTGVLFNEKGETTAKESGYCGNILNLKELQTYSKKTIMDKLSNAYGSTLSNLNLEPNQSLPFMLVFFDPPANISEYSVEVLDFKTTHPRSP